MEPGTGAGRNQPLGGNEMPRFGGPGTMMRLPAVEDPAELDAGFVGVPIDGGTSNRSGTRMGPRSIRAESALLRPYNMGTGAAPFDRLQVGDLGDVAVDPYDLGRALEATEARIAEVAAAECVPLVLGGDHTLTLGVLRGVARRHGPVAMLHVDAHADVNDLMFGERLAHGTWVRRAVEEELVDPGRVVQLGLRGTGYADDDFEWGREQGFMVIQAEECWHRSLAPTMEAVRERLGDGPAYLSFDIDSLDPSLAPGTGTPEIGGLSGVQALEIVRGCRGVSLVGADLVEVSPPYDPSGNTALVGANLLYEILCVLPGVVDAG